MARIVVDPVTRIEGHLRIEAEMKGNAVGDAWSSGTMFRGIELILRGRDPREAWIWAQRICGVCTTVHALASVRAVEDALGVEIPDNARLVRNIIAGAQNVQDHIIHFYHLHALDWVDVTLALKADPAKTSQIAQSISEWPKSSTTYFKAVQDRVKTLVGSGQLSLFASGYWGHPAYRLPPEVNLLAVAHYIEALDLQREFIRIHAVLGGKNPHPQTFLVGGMATAMDGNEPDAVINPERITLLNQLVAQGKTFVDQVYLPDVMAIAGYYKDWFGYGEGLGNFMSYGDFTSRYQNDPAQFLVPRGIVLGRDLSTVHKVEPEKITESVAHSWYHYSGGDETVRNPYEGETNPAYTGPKPPYEYLNVDEKYSWLKAPRYDGKAVEVGPLARVLVAYAAGHQGTRKVVDATLQHFNAPPAVLFSTLGRIAARALEAQLLVNQLPGWVAQLDDNMAHGNVAIHNGEKWDPDSWPKSCRGFGFHEAPRGSLGHWIEIENKQIVNYQAVVPSTWNAGPRDASGQRGAYEAALAGTPIADPERPLEILRTVHSFDPCLACAVHVVGAQGRATTSPLGCAIPALQEV
ncbi:MULTISPECIES: nickel-dependent hydrogenase large subunit [Acidobacterium]|uniref:Nickel-dependent hydrogenase, large subunit n=1 Tax=Acidobacterium capsulatum (strain ATCC 51196 / DSM 11244 / BCRC 80197 / JCM 7670 / NBRC 15755 / NCIMB 13165 / 161) TaxID=240015 RepID=C1F4L0_ACIC5|nr:MULTISPECIES: nickel-dependent hydrogenase large subunit [Acidobacterium]ACO31874.1 nickel-dependent hydrogenase, large subunit [Acidobacterium capsulatum ATCC 51196]HCT61826.1 nickel-dependent hydrogenase large subunit [Acidobacterium sp.]